MGILKQIVDDIKVVADSVKNIQSILAAIKDGKKYFEKTHPEIKQDVAAMCIELQKTCNAIAIASSVITNFRFNSSAGALDNEPTRFNDYFIKYKTNKNEAENLIRSLKGHCRIIKQHSEKISSCNTNAFWAFFGLQSSQRENELGILLQKIYDDEQDYYDIVSRMAHSMNTAIEDVTDALCVNGMMSATKVPAAALLLTEYAKSFKELELAASKTRDEFDFTIKDLQ